jgi:hypothetical protein
MSLADFRNVFERERFVFTFKNIPAYCVVLQGT